MCGQAPAKTFIKSLLFLEKHGACQPWGRLLTPGSRPAPGGSGAGALAGHQGNGGGQGRGVRHKGTPVLAKRSVVEASGDGDVVSKRRRGGTTQGSGTVIYPFETKPCKENVPGSKERMLVHRNGHGG